MITQQEKDIFLQREHCYLAKLVEQERLMLKEREIAAEAITAFDDRRERASLRQGLVDPAVNMEIMLLRQKLREKEQKIEVLQDEVNSTTFDPKSVSGQKIMKKTRQLLEENQDLGRQLAEEKFQDLTVLIKTEKKRGEQLKEKLRESQAFCAVLDEENEKLQSAVVQAGKKILAQAAEINELRKLIDILTKEKCCAVEVRDDTVKEEPPIKVEIVSSREEAPGEEKREERREQNAERSRRQEEDPSNRREEKDDKRRDKDRRRGGDRRDRVDKRKKRRRD